MKAEMVHNVQSNMLSVQAQLLQEAIAERDAKIAELEAAHTAKVEELQKIIDEAKATADALRAQVES